MENDSLDFFLIRHQGMNWCKKQRNRMRSDAAQIIAMSVSWDAKDHSPVIDEASSLVTSLVKDISTPQGTPSHSPQQSAEVVYRERTAVWISLWLHSIIYYLLRKYTWVVMSFNSLWEILWLTHSSNSPRREG